MVYPNLSDRKSEFDKVGAGKCLSKRRVMLRSCQPTVESALVIVNTFPKVVMLGPWLLAQS